ncbi:MAG: hypothetical protein ACI3XI_07590 [Eubacteriales bacterium]
MVKRCISLLLAAIVCFTLAPAVVVSAAKHDETSVTSENLTQNIPVNISMTSVIPGGHLSVPEDILEGSTEELLNYFRETFTTWSGTADVVSHTSVIPKETLNYYNNEAFCELITRPDLRYAIMKNMADIKNGCYVDYSITHNFVTSADEQIKAELGKLRQLVIHIPAEVIIPAIDTNEEICESSPTSQTRASKID